MEELLIVLLTLISPFTFTDKGVVFGTPLTESCIAQIYQLIEYLTKSESSKYNPPLPS